MFLCATQDVAVDGMFSQALVDQGWALTLLSTDNLSYASTAQTIGLNTGYFLSFTVFLAFNSPEFANKYFWKTPRDVGLVSLGGYLKFWGWMYLAITIWLAKFKKEVAAGLTRFTIGTNSHRRWRCEICVPNDLDDLKVTA